MKEGRVLLKVTLTRVRVIKMKRFTRMRPQLTKQYLVKTRNDILMMITVIPISLLIRPSTANT